MNRIVTFGETRDLVREAIREAKLPAGLEVWILRDLIGRVSVLLPESAAEPPEPIRRLVERMPSILGAHAYPPERAVLYLEPEDLEGLRSEAVIWEEEGVKIHFVDREISGRRWVTIADLPGPPRFVLFALKGGLGRSTTAAVLAAHLARKGQRVLVLDFDLESPTLSSMLSPQEQPDFGLVEWLVEDLVDQAEALVPDMIGRPAWSVDFTGEVMVVPAYGRRCQEHLAQLGRAYLDKPPREAGSPPQRWVDRVQRLVQSLEAYVSPDLVIMDSRSGLHDIAAALMVGLPAQVLLFAIDSEPTWSGYRILFQHWAQNQVIRQLRERLSLVAALVPPTAQEEYLRRFRQHAWDLFREWLYDEVPPGEPDGEWFSFDLMEEDAPHNPLSIYWERGLLAWPDLRSLESGPVQSAYSEFLERFERQLLPEAG
ncbi:KGGVGR-motif variant AAA ATPase [Thermoflexus hugenholtzii]